MRNIIAISLAAIIPVATMAQGFNSKGGSHRGYQTPYTQQEQQPSHWSGSGIALSTRVFATNNHVVEGATHLYVYFPESKEKYTAKVIKTDPTNDLAIVRVNDSSFKGFPTIRYGFKKALEDVGTDVFVLGYPRVDTMGEEVKLTTGVVSSRSGFRGDQSQYQVSAPVQPGNSGGPLFNDQGELIGIVSAKHTDGAENVSYAVKLSYLSNLIASAGESISLSRSSQIASMKLSEKCKAVIPCTVMVVADNEREGQSQSSSAYGSTGKYPIRVNMPELSEQNTNTAQIIGIEIAQKRTSVYMTLTNPYAQDIGYSIDKGTYIKDNSTGKKYFLHSVDNIAISPEKSNLPAGYQVDFVLYFPQIPASVISIDLCEPSDVGWQFKGIRTR